MQETRRRERRIIAAFVSAADVGDTGSFGRALSKGLEFYILGRCLSALMRLGRVHDAVRAEFAQSLKTYGDGFRQELRRDLDLVKALRLLLPPYQGDGAVIFRGDSALNRRRRTYGLSWTTDRSVAEDFAAGHWRACDGGSVLLQANAPPQAILFAYQPDDDPYGEAEVMVDRRHLRDVRVIRRFEQIIPRTGTDCHSPKPFQCHIHE
ncbi:hypothetical protein [Methylorubrum extorquens]